MAGRTAEMGAVHLDTAAPAVIPGVGPGRVTGLIGPDGAGKTTLLNIAGLLDTFEEGRYFLDGEDVSRLNDREMSAIRNRKIGFIFQSFNLIPDLNTQRRQNIAFFPIGVM